MITNTNIFSTYTLAIAAQYSETKSDVAEAEKAPKRKVYRTLDSMLEECVFLGATRFGTNFIA